MKSVFTERELLPGMIIIRNDISKKGSFWNGANTVIFQIGWNALTKQFGKTNILTDGCFIPMGETMKEVIDKLNSDNIGYRPITKKEFVKILETSKHMLFY